MRHYFWVFVEKFGVLLLKVLSIALLARMLSPDDFGLYAMVAAIVAVASMLVDSGMGGALIRKDKLTDLDYSSVFIFNLVVSICIYSAVYLTAPLVAEFYRREELVLLIRVVGVILVVRALCIVQVTRLTKEFKFKSQSLIFLMSGCVSLIVAYVMARKGFGYWSLVAQQLTEAVLSLVALWVYTKYFPGMRFSLIVLKGHFDFGSKLMLSSIVDVLYANTIVVLIGKSLGAGVAGLYFQANRINEIFIGLLTTIVDKTSFPILVKKMNSQEGFYGYASSLLMAVCFIGFFCVAVLASCSRLIIDIFLGHQWMESAWILETIALAGYGMIFESVTRAFLKAHGRSDIILKLSVAKGLISITALMLLSILGLSALLYGFVALSVVNALLNGLVVHRVAGFQFDRKIFVIFRIFSISVLVGVCIRELSAHLVMSSIFSLIILVPVAALIYSSLSWLVLRSEIKMIVSYFSPGSNARGA